jgi:hypothetical protein
MVLSRAGIVAGLTAMLIVLAFGQVFAQAASTPVGGDTTPPSVSLTAPSAGDTVSGITTLKATASDNVRVDHVDFRVDEDYPHTVPTQTSGSYAYDWNARNVGNGTHTVTVSAVDTARNTTTTKSTTVVVSNSRANLLQNPSLEAVSGSGPSCWTLGGYGANTFSWTRTNDVPTPYYGGFAENLDVSSYTNGDRKLLSAQDSGTCAPPAIPGHTYSVSAWYYAPAMATQPVFFAFYRNTAGQWLYWAQSPKQPNYSSWWNEATWRTPPVPAGATALSVGTGLSSAGNVTMDDFSLYDNAPPPDTTPPSTAIRCGTEGCMRDGYYGNSVQVSMAATDGPGGSGVSEIRYTTDGSDPTNTNGRVYSGAFTVGTTSTVKYRAVDKAGNAGPVKSSTIQVDTTDPTTTMRCDGSLCGTTWYRTGLSVDLSALDSGGAGVRDIRYTTDGSDPTLGNGQSYVGPFSVTSTATVKYRAYDEAGHEEAINTQKVNVDSASPTSAISCGDAFTPCPASVSGGTDVYLGATDNDSGVTSIRYTTDGSDPTATTGETFVGPLHIDSTTRLKYRAYDAAGNVEPINEKLITVPPATVALESPTDGALLSRNEQLSATVGGIVVDHVDFVIDDRVVGTATSSPYSSSWDTTTVADGAHTVQAHAFDLNGVETDSVRSNVTVNNASPDTTPPTSSITCDTEACKSGFSSSGVSARLAADDGPGGSGIKQIRYTTDGSDPTATTGTVYSGAVGITKTTTIKYLAIDRAGNVEPVHTQKVNVDTLSPNSAIQCNSVNCAGYYKTAASVSLKGTDTGGSGLDAVRYTTDGTNPTASNGTAYTGAFAVDSTKTVKYRAFDRAGNAEPVNSALIKVDTTPPSSSATCNADHPIATVFSRLNTVQKAEDLPGLAEALGEPYVWAGLHDMPDGACPQWMYVQASGYFDVSDCCFKPGASLALFSTDADSGAASIRYTTNGTDPTATTGTPYSGPLAINATTTVKYRAFDKAGNAEPVNTQKVQIDDTAPYQSIVRTPRAGSIVSGLMPISASAVDGETMHHVDFLVDGNKVGSCANCDIGAMSPSPWDFNWDSTTVPDGVHKITAVAVDSAGNTTTSDPVSVTVVNNNLLKNPSLESATGTTPACWTLGGWGNNTFAWTRTNDAHTGSFGETLAVSAFTDGDRKMVNTQDTGTCAPAVTAGKTYTATFWYKSPNQPVLYAHMRNSAGQWVYWAQSPKLPSASTWTRATWTTPAVPAGTTHIVVGPGLNGVGSMTMDDIGLFGNG